MKTCPKCRKLLPSDFFYKDKGRWDGISIWCKACKRESAAVWARENRPRKNKTDAAFKRRRRDRDRAHGAVKRAIKKGTLARPGECQVCGNHGPIEGHHLDYTKPLEVVWLCKECHGRAHSTDGLSL